MTIGNVDVERDVRASIIIFIFESSQVFLLTCSVCILFEFMQVDKK